MAITKNQQLANLVINNLVRPTFEHSHIATDAPAQLRRSQPAVFLLPVVERRFTDPQLPANFRYRRACLRLLQWEHDLRLCELRSLDGN